MYVDTESFITILYTILYQEPKSDKDEEHCRKVNDYLNNPPTPGSSRGNGGGGGFGGLSGLPPELAGLGGADSDLQSLLGNLSQQQLMQLLGKYFRIYSHKTCIHRNIH